MRARYPLFTRRLALAAAVAAASATALVRAQGGPPGGGGAAPAPAPPPRAGLRAFAATEGQWAWLKETPNGIELYSAAPGAPGTLVARGAGWSEVALLDGAAWILQQGGNGSGPTAALLRAELRPGSVPAVVAPLAQGSMGGLMAAGGRLYWAEATPPAAPAFGFVPPAGSLLRWRCREPGGEVRLLGEWPGAGATPAGFEPVGAGDLFGATGEALFARARRLTGVDLVRVPLAGGTPARLAAEDGPQQAALQPGGAALYWTAFSEEASPSLFLTCVRRLSLAGSARAEPETLTDWLLPAGRLVATGDRLYYVTDEVYEVPRSLGPPTRRSGDLPGPVAGSAGNAVIITQGNTPVAVPL
jgi:hypothetical protein